MIKKTFLFLYLSMVFVICKGQSYYFENYQVDNGLSHNTVRSVIQDQKGFMWIGTKGGLNRFDGCYFKNFLIPEERSGANSINVLSEDNKGMLWIGTLSGLFVFDPHFEHIERANAPYTSVHDIKRDHQDHLWMIASGKINTYNQETRKNINTGINATALGFDEYGTLWAGTGKGGLKTIDINGPKLRVKDVHMAGLVHISLPIIRILPVKGYVLFGTRRGFFRYDVKTQQVTALLTKNPDGTDVYVRDIKILDDGKCWLATESGIYIYDLLKGTYLNIKKRAGDQYSLSDNAVYTLFQDRRKGIWAGTFFGGLSHLSMENNEFEKYFPINAANSVSGNAVREICADEDSNIWIGTEDAGINKFDPVTRVFSHFSNGKRPSDLSYPNIHGLLVDKNEVLAGPFFQGLEILNRNSGKVVKRYPVARHPGSVSNAFVMSIFKTSAGRILVGTTGAGLLYYEPGAKGLVPIPQIPERSFAYAIAEDHTGTIWTGSLGNGAFFFNPKTGRYGNVSFKTNSDLSPGDDMIQGIYEDSRKNLWFATEGGVLIKLSRDHKTFKRFTTKNGFPTNNIFRILEDDTRNLWISSLKGLICLNLNTERFYVYSKSNGLLTDQFNYSSAFKDKNGKMYFGSVKGLISFHPDSLKKKTPIPPLYITSVHISANGANHPPNVSQKKSMIYSDAIELTYDQSTFDIEFAALDYSAPDLIRYRYRMEGLNEEWTHIHTNRKAYFTNLAPGEYKFVVQAKSNIGLWETPVRTFYIKISPPFWKSTAAYIFYTVFLCAALCITVYVYHRNIENKNRRRQQLFELEKEKEVYQAKIEFFTNIAHEIQTPLTLIKGPIDWALSKIEDTTTVRRNLELVKKNMNRLIALTSQLLDFRKTEQYEFTLNFVYVDINQLIADQVEAFSSYLATRNLNLDLNLPEKHVKAFVDKEACTKMISNLISNAVKYSEKNIVISLFPPEDEKKGSFRLRIENDGEVIASGYQHKIFEPFFRIKNQNNIRGTGIGLALSKYLAELHHGKLVLIVDKEINIFELILPINQKIQFDLERLRAN